MRTWLSFEDMIALLFVEPGPDKIFSFLGINVLKLLATRPLAKPDEDQALPPSHPRG
jgi:hypothetical protein